MEKPRVANLERLFSPRGIAIVGASPDPNRPGAQTLKALLDRNYRGRIYPVNPKYREIESLQCVSSVAQIREACDVAVIALPARQVCAVVAEC